MSLNNIINTDLYVPDSNIELPASTPSLGHLKIHRVDPELPASSQMPSHMQASPSQ